MFAVALRRPVDFFLTTTRDIRRWIFDSRFLFCWTERSELAHRNTLMNGVETDSGTL